MPNMKLDQINLNIDVLERWQARYEAKRDKIESTPVKGFHVYTGLVVGTMAGIAIVGQNMLDLGAMILGGMAGGITGSLVPLAVKKIKIGELNYQIYTTKDTIKMLEKEKDKLQKTLIKK